MLASNVGGLLEKDQQLGVEQVAHDGEQHAAAKVAQRHGRQSFKNSWKTPGVRILLTGECSQLLITSQADQAHQAHQNHSYHDPHQDLNGSPGMRPSQQHESVNR